jgi:hypothetical protein
MYITMIEYQTQRIARTFPHMKLNVGTKHMRVVFRCHSSGDMMDGQSDVCAGMYEAIPSIVALPRCRQRRELYDQCITYRPIV